MYEIYYTSAPSGLKRGTSGFCTVAATDGIPKPLLERLESLSAYRHHFAQGDGQVNPVSFGHYRLAAQGKEYHVLSRVCDSGVDHTHRTNAFAHHLALDKSELLLEGPAALLQTPRLMVAQWDSAVGPLSRASLPGAIETIPGPCTAWQALAGDAGYAGLLLESAIKSPTKPVCILFSPGQDMLPLIAEVLRLVPTPLRWAITFNTYFTSMPSSATCTWRCCLAKTPAADAALRAASTGGIVLNLADRAKLPPLPGAGKNPYIESARDGMPLATKAKAKVGAAPKKPGGNGNGAGGTGGVKVPPKAESVTVDAIEEIADEIARAVQQYGTTPPPPPSSPPSSDMSASPQLAPSIQRKSLASGPPTDAFDERFKVMQTPAELAQKKRQQQMLLMYGSAIGALAVGSLLLLLAYKFSHGKDDYVPPPPPPPPTQPVAIAVTKPVEIKAPETAPAAATETAPAPTQPAPATQVIVVVPPRPPHTITLRTPLDSPTGGAGIRDRAQSFTLTGDDADDMKNAATIALAFPGDSDTFKYDSESLSGTFTLTPVGGGFGRPSGLLLHWKGTLDFSTTDIATLTWNRPTRTFELTWKSGAALKRPEAVSLAYWLLANSTVLGIDQAGDRTKAQKLRFKSAELPPIPLVDLATPFKLPADVPANATPAVTSALPAGWAGEWYTEWETKDVALRSADNKLATLRLKRPTSSIAIDAWFTITLKPHFASVETNFAKRLATEESDLNRAEGELRALDRELARLAQEAGQDLQNYTRSVTECLEKQKAPVRFGLTAAEAAAQVKQAQIALDARTARLENDSKPFNSKRLEIAATVAAHREAIAACRQLDNLEVSLRIPSPAGEIPTLIVRFKQ